MSTPASVVQIFLAPGELYFGQSPERIRTLLGSCVAITLWHPLLKLGGMCHFMLPNRPKKTNAALDGRYADEAIELFLHEIRHNKTHPTEYQAKIFGGGNMFPSIHKDSHCLNIGARNCEAARQLLGQHRFQLVSEDLSGIGHRVLMFDLENGAAWLKHTTEGLQRTP